MSILVIGGDKINSIRGILQNLGAKSVTHWDTRKKTGACKKEIPQNTDCVLMLTDFLNHNVMYKFKNEAKKKKIPYICSKRSVSSVHCEFCKFMGRDGCEK
eukprot:Anaeramoba_flamelloidesa1058892_491.p3 GENE.a1058892_491~~a1058892_491.p3  ORF type:complete len:101 (+),score=1.29 a1058892_491:195-497(+)